MNLKTTTERWLANNVQSYPQTDRVYADIQLALLAFPTLRPKSDVYTYDDGRTQLLLCIHGLLPISYRNSSYNIPITVWITRDYPRHPPISYVVPTTDMLIKPGKYIDVSGKCEIEYSQQWSRKSEACNLKALLEAMQSHFSAEPPVYAKPQSDIHPKSPPQLLRAPQPRPTLPPKPSSPLTPLMLQDVDPPLPPRPPSDAFRYGPFHPTPPVLGPFQFQASDPQYTLPRSTPPPPPVLPMSHHPNTLVLHDNAIPQNLLDEDSPESGPPPPSTIPLPPRPPNPELLHLHSRVYQKLTSEINSLSQALALDTERLRAHQTDLLAGEPAIRDEMARLQAVRDVCRNVTGRVKTCVEQAELNIAELHRKGDPEVDELICSTTIVHNQLISLVAEDHAIEDTIYHLHRALNVGRIDLERFLRSTRLLAEEQFMKRALIGKIHTGVSSDMWKQSGSRWY